MTHGLFKIAKGIEKKLPIIWRIEKKVAIAMGAVAKVGGCHFSVWLTLDLNTLCKCKLSSIFSSDVEWGQTTVSVSFWWKKTSKKSPPLCSSELYVMPWYKMILLTFSFWLPASLAPFLVGNIWPAIIKWEENVVSFRWCWLTFPLLSRETRLKVSVVVVGVHFY